MRGILFDKDGTLIDYHASFMSLNWKMARGLADGDEALARRLMIVGGWDPALDRVRSGSPLAAWTLREIAESLQPEVPARDIEDVFEIVNRAFDIGPAQAVAVADLPVLLGELKKMDIMLGISTSDHTRAARETVERFGIGDAMDFVAGYDAGYGAKPGPGMIEGFCEACQIEPQSLMVVGDNSHDIDFARNGNAGWAVGVLTGTSERADLEPIADHVLDDITRLPDLIRSL